MARSTKTEHRLRQRARIVLLAAAGMASRAIGRIGQMHDRHRVEVARALRRDGGWRVSTRPASGAPSRNTRRQTGKRILALLDQPPPTGYARWSGPLLAAALGDVDVQYVWRFLRAQKIDLAGRKSWCESNDPEFVAKAADVVGLYMAPPENAIVICVDEKPSIQALERAQGYLKLPNGRALTGHSHDYKRHGTSTLFAAFEVATGKVTAAHKKRRRRIEFLDFMNDIVAAHPTPPSTSSSTISTPTSPGTIAGSSVIRTCISTSRRPGPPGSTKWKSGSRSCKESPCTALPSPRSTAQRAHRCLHRRLQTNMQSRSSGPKSKVHQKRLKPRFANQ